ncbi:MAG: hypothetical protein JRI22_03460 [Deltaproteobacteria bacterium]|nr:hypothetical protein [Deltaproteobacteria bacterium]
MEWILTIFGIFLLTAGMWGGHARRGIIGTLMAAMAMAGVIVFLAGVVRLFVPGFFSWRGGV